MGLEITAYRKLTPASGVGLDQDGYPVDEECYWRAFGALVRFTEEYWPGRSDGIKPDQLYRFDGSFSFLIGSHTWYGRWRDELALLMLGKYAEDVQKGIEGPFFELIDFADNEGIIGPKIAAKLAKDFAENESKAVAFASKHVEGTGWLEDYQNWKRAFELAANGGAVELH